MIGLSCSDVYHVECIRPWLATCIDNQTLPIRCPDPQCKLPISLLDLSDLLTFEQLKRCQKFEWKKIRDQNPDMEECPTENCDYFFYKGDGDDLGTYHHCPSCGVQYCLRCKVAYHLELTCAEYQQRVVAAKADAINKRQLPEDLQLEAWAKKAGAKRCAKCKFFVQKGSGCNHMTCRCGYEFCYVCGGKYKECECVKKLQSNRHFRNAESY